MQYYVREPLSAVVKEPASSAAFLTIDSGSLITVKGYCPTFGFVEVNYGGEDVLVFTPDLERMTECLKGQGQ